MVCALRKHSQGMTLVELMITLLLSSMLAIMILNTFLFIKRSVLTQQALVRLQVNARTLDYLLGKALRNSGVFGCRKLQAQDRPFLEIDIPCSKGVLGILPQQLPKHFKGTERVLRRYKKESDMLWLQSSKPYLSTTNLRSGTILAISDCKDLTFFRKCEDAVSVVKAPFQLSVLTSTVYYVGDTRRKNTKGKTIYALYATDFNGRTLELVEGVEKLEIVYGSFIEGALIYQKAHEVTDWYAIVSVRLKALLNTIEETEPIITKWWHYEWSLM